MTRFGCEQAEKNAAEMVATLMAASARTAPKARGIDDMESLILEGEDIEELATAMERKAEEKPSYLSSAFKRDANNLRSSNCVLLIGVAGNPKKIEQPLDCGACGYEGCVHLTKVRKRVKDFNGPICILGSAVKLAGELNIDNRMMYTVGVAAKELKMLNSDLIIGIPLSVTGKSPYFDRQ